MKPELSVAMIFKNEIRCLERCLRSVGLLRERLAVELVMADTGSDDGSRAVAERYADVLFDFPWADDFSAARNAVLSRCRGRWILTLDSDEWLEDVSELAGFLRSPEGKRCDEAMVIQRNYFDPYFEHYTDGAVPRMMCAASRPVYVGAIHEVPRYMNAHSPVRTVMMKQTFLHHDGYASFNSGSDDARRKKERNMSLLRKALAENPDDLRLLRLACDSATSPEENAAYLRHAVELIRAAGRPRKACFEPPLLSEAVLYATQEALPERDEWAALSRELFPDAYSTRVDIPYALMVDAAAASRHREAVRHGEEYLQGRRAAAQDPDLAYSGIYGELHHADEYSEQNALLLLAQEYGKLGENETALSMLEKLSWDKLNKQQTLRVLECLTSVYLAGGSVPEELVRSFWCGICAHPDQPRTAERKAALLAAGSGFFNLDPGLGGAAAEALFAPLRGMCPLGDAAALLRCNTAEEASAILAGAEAPLELPAPALFHAFRLGCAFPPPGIEALPEELETLAIRLQSSPEELAACAIAAAKRPECSSLPELLWQRTLALAAVRVCDWSVSADRMALLRAFAVIESVFLPVYYTQEALREWRLLPPMHRFGFCAARAFEALDDGHTAQCVHLIREGLACCPDASPMAGFLLDALAKQQADVPAELLALAEKIRAILSSYPDGDPAVAALKESPAYQKVARLIEDPRSEEGG